MTKREIHYGQMYIDWSMEDALHMDMVSHHIIITSPDGRKIAYDFTTRQGLSFACVDLLVGVSSLLCDGLDAEERAEIERLDGLKNLMYSVTNEV